MNSKSGLKLAAFVVVLGAALFGVGWLLLWRPAEVVVAAKPAAVDSAQDARVDAGLKQAPFVVTSVTGEVKRRTATAQDWGLIREGDGFDVRETLQTPSGGRITIRGRDRLELTLLSSALATLDSIGPGGTDIHLGRGLLDAKLTGGAPLRVKADSGTFVQTTRGRVRVLRSDSSGLSVSVFEGSAELSSGGSSQPVAQGQVSSARRGRQPRPPQAIPESMLKAKTSGQRLVRRDSEEIVGKATPGSLVVVAGEVVGVDRRGRFRRVVPLKEGVNRLQVVMYGLDGKEKKWEAPPIRRDTRAPATKFGQPRFEE